jgi:uncharacterized protein
MYVQMTVETLAVTTDGGPCAVILRGVDLPVMLPIIIAPPQAAAIAAVNFSFPRPLTHDLMVTLLDELGGSIKRVMIHDIQEATFHARIEVSARRRDGRDGDADDANSSSARSSDDADAARVDGGSHELDCRPSDAIALAVRLALPVLVSSDVLARADGVRWGQPSPDENSDAAAGDDADGTGEIVPFPPEPETRAEPPVSEEQLAPYRSIVERLNLEGL